MAKENLPTLREPQEVIDYLERKDGWLNHFRNYPYFYFILFFILSFIIISFNTGVCFLAGAIAGGLYTLKRVRLFSSYSAFPNKFKIVFFGILSLLSIIFYFISFSDISERFLVICFAFFGSLSVVNLILLHSENDIYEKIRSYENDVDKSLLRFMYFYDGKTVNYVGDFSYIDGLDGRETLFNYAKRKTEEGLESRKRLDDLIEKEENELKKENQKILSLNIDVIKTSEYWEDYLKKEKEEVLRDKNLLNKKNKTTNNIA